MRLNLFIVKIRDKNTKCKKVLELLKLSLENILPNFDYIETNEESPNQNLEIIVDYNNKYIKNFTGKMIYEATKNKKIKIFNEEFILNNIKRARMIINNKQYYLKEIVENRKRTFKIKIKFLDIIIYLNSMFKDCKSLSSVYNYQNFNTKYLKAICNLFEGCISLFYIEDIPWNIKNIKNKFFNQFN